MAEPLLSVGELAVSYGGAVALGGISFEVRAGEVVALIGGNGAGKTTTLKSVSGVREAWKSTTGSITFGDRRIERRPSHAIARLGIAHVPEGRRVFAALSVDDNLRLGGYQGRRDRRRIDLDLQRVYERFPILGDRRTQRAGLLSGGEQQMLAIGRGLMSRPKLMLLDEPSLGLAPMIVTEMFRTIRALADDGMTILLVEQLANKALAVADRAYVLETGRVVMSGAAAQVAADPAIRAAYLGG